MAEDRWNDSRYRRDEPIWDDDRSRDRERMRARGDDDRRGPENFDRYDQPYRPFGDSGPVYGRSGAYDEDGRPYRGERHGRSGRYEDMSPAYREFEADQRRRHGGDYDPGRYTPNPREGRDAEPRSWWDRTQDEMASWFGDEHARRRREWDERMAEVERSRERNARGDDRRDEGGLFGQHRGRGPKGYRRSDERIAEDINDRLTDDPQLDASEIEVSVRDGEATLTGLVFRREDKRRAEDLAERVAGVSHVQNNLRLRRDEDYGSRSTGDITL